MSQKEKHSLLSDSDELTVRMKRAGEMQIQAPIEWAGAPRQSVEVWVYAEVIFTVTSRNVIDLTRTFDFGSLSDCPILAQWAGRLLYILPSPM